MPSETESPLPSKDADHTSPDVDTTADGDGSEAAPRITIDKLTEYTDDPETARLISELARGRLVASIYIDQRRDGVFFGGEANIRGDVLGRGTLSHGYKPGTSPLAPSIAKPITIEMLDKIRMVYVQTSLYRDAHALLHDAHIVVLWGQSHLGKRATAIHLLLSADVDKILELHPDIDVHKILKDEPEAGTGYIVDTMTTFTAPELTPSSLAQLGAYLKDKNSYLVITVDREVSLARKGLDEQIIIWTERPDSMQLLQNHFAWYLSTEEKVARALQVCQDDPVRELLGTQRLPHELDHLAQLISRVVRNKIGLDEALSSFAARASKQVEEWFETHISTEQRTFMIALAVLSGAKYQAVSDADARLQEFLAHGSAESGSSAPEAFFKSRKQKVETALAHLSQGYEDTEFGRTPIEIVELDNPVLQPAVLRYIWTEYDGLRSPLVDWLRELGTKSNYDVRIRVAAAAGELSKYDFTYIKEQVLTPWATHADKRARAAAAFALGIPAWEGNLAPQVLGLLHHWSTLPNNWRLNWTAAAAYGGLVGLRFPDTALRGLQNIAQLEDLRLFSVVSRSVVNLVYAREATPDDYLKILDSIVDWTKPPVSKIVTLTGLLVFLDLIEEARTDAVPDAESWPALLWLSQGNPALTDKITELWRRALNTKASRKSALETLRKIVKEADDDARLKLPLEQILTEMVRQGTQREQERLRYFLNCWADDPRGESPSARHLRTVLAEIE